jgi:hypothetical protein
VGNLDRRSVLGRFLFDVWPHLCYNARLGMDERRCPIHPATWDLAWVVVQESNAM